MKIAGIIPARYASTRFPGKPLANIKGKSMIMRVYEQASKLGNLNEVIVATDDQRIFRHVIDNGGKAVMTAMDHSSGTSRCAEALRLIEREGQFDAVINIQGDEPFIRPQQIEKVIELLYRNEVAIATLYKQITVSSELFDPNVVKTIVNSDGKAL
ncbi:MAG TPA: 3-deoxy-manno-octulosonate cytidylyltransferase, partial [Bacteroidales bacterium]|nr:3-deoxy-manno-octulosonate cytidylyltransferase [Bacteroidales bacterium]